MNFVKFHLPVHSGDDIHRYGTSEAWNNGPGEARHKTEAKLPSKTTQRRSAGLELQTATRHSEHICIKQAYRHLQINGKVPPDKPSTH